MTEQLHANARTTREIRQAIRESPESLKVLAHRFGINPKTVAKWKRRDSAEDLPTGPRRSLHGKLTAEEETIIVGFREHTLLPLDDCLYALQARIPHLSRSTLHRCLQRHGISRLPAQPPATDVPGPVAEVPIGCFHIDRIEVRAGDAPLQLFIAIDQASKFVFVQLARRDGSAAAAAFLVRLIAAVPFAIHTVLTSDAAPFAAAARETRFARLCREHGIDHQPMRLRHPWPQGGGRMGRVLRELNEARVAYESEAHLTAFLREFVGAYNHRRRLKTLRGLTPYDYICRRWQEEPQRFRRDPHHEMTGLECMTG